MQTNDLPSDPAELTSPLAEPPVEPGVAEDIRAMLGAQIGNPPILSAEGDAAEESEVEGWASLA